MEKILLLVTAIFAVLFLVRKRTVWLIGCFSSLNSLVAFLLCNDIYVCALVFFGSFAVIGIVAVITVLCVYLKRKNRNVNKV